MVYFLWVLAIWSICGPLVLATYTRKGRNIEIELEIVADEYAKLFAGGPAVWLILLARILKG